MKNIDTFESYLKMFYMIKTLNPKLKAYNTPPPPPPPTLGLTRPVV